MRALGSTAALERFPWRQARAPGQFHPEPGLDASRDVRSPDREKPSFDKRTDPATPTPTEISFGSFRLLPGQFLLLEGDEPVRLGSRALEILIVLLERPGELVSKQELMGRVWPDTFVEPANLTVHISALRRTLRDGRDGNRFIINVPGRGYSFVGLVELPSRENRTVFAGPVLAAGASWSPTIAAGDTSSPVRTSDLQRARATGR
jgi:DNA-binding winged helix-turn-helix (wHTH) protein